MASWTSWRFFMSALSTDSVCYGLNVKAHIAAAGTPVILWPWQGGHPNELWRIDPDGRIITALGDGQSLVLGLGGTYGWGPNGNYIVLCKLDSKDPTQLWSFGANGMITNQANPSMVINVDGGAGVSGASIITYPVQTGPSSLDEIWWGAPIVPMKPSPNWVFIQSGLTDTVNTYGLAVQGSGAVKGAVLAPYAPGQAAQAWQLPGDGTIVSALSDDLPIGLGLGAPDLRHPHETPLLVDPIVPGASAQQWTIGDGTIVNVKNGNALTASVPEAPVVTAPIASGSPSTQNWTLLSINPLASILVQAPEPFPAFQGDQAAAYASINEQLGFSAGTTLRDQYVILDPAALAKDAGRLSGLICPPDVSTGDWNAVIDQLTAELNGAIPVQSLFSDYAAFHTQMFTQQEGLVNQLITDAQIESGTDLNGSIASVLEAILYLGFSEVPRGGSIVANLMEVGLAIGRAVASATPVGDSFQVACSSLWNELNTNFGALADAISNAAYVVLSDWGRLRAVTPLTTSTAVGGLGWPIANDLATALTPAFTAWVMQLLMPTKYMLWYGIQPNQEPLSGVPSYDQYLFPWNFGTWYVTWIGEIGNDNHNPSEVAMNDIFGPQMNGYVNPSDFWLARNGWNFQIQAPIWDGTVPAPAASPEAASAS